MAKQLPYMVAYNLIGDILEAIKKAKTPTRFTHDFLETKLGFSGGSARAAVPFLKRLGFLETDGTPTERYKRFRNPNERVSGAAMAEAIRDGYSQLFTRNEYAYELDESELQGLVVELTGSEPDAPVVRRVVKTIGTLKEFANFETSPGEDAPKAVGVDQPEPVSRVRTTARGGPRLSYTINLNLPETSDIAVFNAIFASLRENLLKWME